MEFSFIIKPRIDSVQTIKLPIDTFGFSDLYNACVKAYGPINTEYLSKLCEVSNKALNQYSRVLAIRVDLRFRQLDDGYFSLYQHTDNDVISRFFKVLKYLLESHVSQRGNFYGVEIDPTVLRYIWVREQNEGQYQHYHAVLLLNKNTFRQLGKFNAEDNHSLATIIQLAWAKAVGIPEDQVGGLVDFP